MGWREGGREGGEDWKELGHVERYVTNLSETSVCWIKTRNKNENMFI